MTDTFIAHAGIDTMPDMIDKYQGGVFLLWTGGWDSTFRLVELSRLECLVQPIYICDPTRPSAEYENKAQQEILELLRTHPSTRAEILPLKRVDFDSIPINQEITDAYKRITSSYRLGSQYEYIARYASINPGLELCSEKSPRGSSFMHKLITSEGAIVPTADIHNYKVVSENRDVNLLLGNLYFPITDKLEIDMVRLIKELNYEDIMSHIWFCYTPINGKPCGTCRPCQEKMESNMEFLLSPEAQNRYYKYKRLNSVRETFSNNKILVTLMEKIRPLVRRIIRN